MARNRDWQLYFVSWPRFRTRVADRRLTISDLKAVPSLRIGLAASFTIGLRPGFFSEPGVDMSGEGRLQNGRPFAFQASAAGKSITPKHVKIEFK